MSDDPTRELPKDTSFEARVFAELAAIRGEFRGELAAIRGEFRGEFATIHGEFATIHGELAAIRTEQAAIRSDIATLNARQERFEDRLAALEEKVDSRLKETRPIWESVQLAMERLEMKFDKIIRELYEHSADIGLHDKRLTKLETG